MVDSFLSAEVGQTGQDVSLGVLLGEDVGNHDGLSWLEVPDVDVMDVDDSLDGLEFCP